ncbi:MULTISPECIES: hypothetical protein [unclassified Streptomyces]|uniref:hypothetical protein n=1 Tax=unclassified Streptomyces TaxID=2593676 RepID=UPI002E22A6FA|nr:hypothetical protein OG282_31360 [Streptomyces sp. NBC_01014]WSX71417.1 hypothetical protein OG221_35095 [Streptomyces sp. NBC_00932]
MTSQVQLSACTSAELAQARRRGDKPVTVEAVQCIALTEFSLLIDDRQSRAAHAQRRNQGR